MRRAQVWTSKNMWGEIERWYRLPVKIDATTIVDLAGTVETVEGPWTSVFRTELWTATGQVWLTAHKDSQLVCATTSGQGSFRDVDERVASCFGALEELITEAEALAA
ncbi:MAG: hypothetical protein GY913_31555 [Proteobacteria bacterium]|nr:hypothetical protein [Pseudomonadota bacterium]MCP4921457.1 hypothetical protein [Pseudomonadota bacterium]